MRWVYQRKDRAKLRIAQERSIAIESSERQNLDGGADFGRTGSRAEFGTSLSTVDVSALGSDIEGRNISTAGSSTGLPLSSAGESGDGSANGKKRRSWFRSSGNLLPGVQNLV